MRVVLQRVSEASVRVDGEMIGAIGPGLLLFLGVAPEDDSEDLEWLVSKVSRMRIFGDEEGKMNRSLLDEKGDALAVSQFTLHASTKKGNRPGFGRAAPPELAEAMYEKFCERLREALPDGKVATGKFGADMKVALLNEGPVTIVIDSKARE